jgi:hypothetical protein
VSQDLDHSQLWKFITHAQYPNPPSSFEAQAVDRMLSTYDSKDPILAISSTSENKMPYPHLLKVM